MRGYLLVLTMLAATVVADECPIVYLSVLRTVVESELTLTIFSYRGHACNYGNYLGYLCATNSETMWSGANSAKFKVQAVEVYITIVRLLEVEEMPSTNDDNVVAWRICTVSTKGDGQVYDCVDNPYADQCVDSADLNHVVEAEAH